jgi:hypothetical protein
MAGWAPVGVGVLGADARLVCDVDKVEAERLDHGDLNRHAPPASASRCCRCITSALWQRGGRSRKEAAPGGQVHDREVVERGLDEEVARLAHRRHHLGHELLQKRLRGARGVRLRLWGWGGGTVQGRGNGTKTSYLASRGVGGLPRGAPHRRTRSPFPRSARGPAARTQPPGARGSSHLTEFDGYGVNKDKTRDQGSHQVTPRGLCRGRVEGTTSRHTWKLSRRGSENSEMRPSPEVWGPYRSGPAVRSIHLPRSAAARL